ncbi:MAG TPA: dihydroxyacetone kinase family protein [Solirubrobacteraceae bacterium]|nr:dihydroxyacetone kinase family protein [Solirubrobacteraceae bacterium]
MTHVFNDPVSFKDEMLEGFLSAYGRYVERVPGASGVMRAGAPREGKVSVIIGGGSGHYPAFCGVVGVGLADGAVMGDIFASPSTEQAYRVGKALDGGAGILFSYGNYAGDVLNFNAAEERLRAEGIDCRTVLVTDDIASAEAGDEGRRRGIAGDLPVFKAAAAAGDRGASLDDVERIALKANARTRSFGVAFAGCTLPGKSEPMFTVEPGRMELGLGIHGEPGIRSVARMSAQELAQTLVKPLLAERPEAADGRAGVFLNGLGATKYEELFVVWKDVAPALDAAGVRIVLPEVGELVTSLNMAGCSLTVFWLDDELEELWAAPADTPAFRRGQVSGAPAFDRRERSAAADGGPATEDVAASPESVRAAAVARKVLDAMEATIAKNEKELGRLDSVAGDGDHGTGMLRGFRAATAAGHAAEGGTGTVLREAGMAFGDKAGGTSGMLWGEMLVAAGNALGDTETPTPARGAAAARRAAETVQTLGKASLGDKTLLDALLPFVDALDAGLGAGKPLPDAWAAAAGVADESAQHTAEFAAKVGRSRPLAERSIGTPDPGAISMALCVAAASDVIARVRDQRDHG